MSDRPRGLIRLARSAASFGFSFGRELPVVFAATLRGLRSALAAEDGGRGYIRLREKIASQSQCIAQQFTAAIRAVLRQRGKGSEDMVRFFDEVL